MRMALKLSMILCGALERVERWRKRLRHGAQNLGPLTSVYREWSKSEDDLG